MALRMLSADQMAASESQRCEPLPGFTPRQTLARQAALRQGRGEQILSSTAPAMPRNRPNGRDDFGVAIVCALPLEYDAVSYIFDAFWDEDGDPYGRAIGDPNSYTTGRIGDFNVVLALLPHMGRANAASAAASMRSSYAQLRLALLVGVCGGAPRLEQGEVFLGDVVISQTVV